MRVLCSGCAGVLSESELSESELSESELSESEVSESERLVFLRISLSEADDNGDRRLDFTEFQALVAELSSGM